MTSIPDGEATAASVWRPAANSAKIARAVPIQVVVEHRLEPVGRGSELNSLVAAIRSALAQGQGLVVHVTAAQSGEGVSLVARELAFAVAGFAAGEVLLVEGTASDKGAIATALGISEDLPLWSLAESGKLTCARLWRERQSCCLAQLPLDRLPDLRLVPGLYAALRASFSLTVVDCPPVLDDRDFVNLAEQADGVVLVVEAERTRIPVVQRAKDELLSSGANFIGVVLNKPRHYIPGFIYRWL